MRCALVGVVRVLAAAVLVGAAACGPPPPPAEPPSWPTLEPTPTYNSRVVALRTSLGRAAIKLEMRGAVETIRGSACDNAKLQVGCPRCELAGETDPLDAAVLEALVTAFDRYPANVLEDTRVERVALCRELRYEDFPDRPTAGTVDLRDRRLYINLAMFLDRTYSPNGSMTTEDIVHHELFHLFEYERMRDRYEDDPEWRLHNPIGFEYRERSMALPRPPGFVNIYASHNEVEDRASVYQYLMARPDELCEIGSADEVVRTKVRLVWKRIAALTDDAFLRTRAPCVDWLADAAPELPTGKLRRTEAKQTWLRAPRR